MVSHYSKNKGETHRFCSACLEYLIHLHGYPATCAFCGESLIDEDYWQVLSPNLKELVSMLKEERNPFLPMKKPTAQTNGARLLREEEFSKLDYDASGVAECKKCKQRFCLSCHVPWHDFMSCKDYKKSDLAREREVDDKRLFRLAERNLWIKCNECERIIDLYGSCAETSSGTQIVKINSCRKE